MSYSAEELQAFYEYATYTQQCYIEAVLETGSMRAAAKKLGVHRKAVWSALQRAEKNAAQRGISLKQNLRYPVAPGFRLKGVSDLVGPNNELKLRWLKTKEDPEEKLQLAVDAIKEAFSVDLPKTKPIKSRRQIYDEDLMIVYPMGDPHLGMYAWAEETGEDFDVEIAETNLVAATTRLIDCAPAAKLGMIVNVGDFYHSDNQSNRTARSGNSLDVDTRWAKVLRVGVQAMRSCIEAALLKHERVHVINEIGNHDDHTAIVLTLALSLAYENNPRVTFDESPMRFHYFRFGKVLVGVNHGDAVKPEKLNGIMSTDRPQDWGETEFRYWYTGHVHTNRKFELHGCTVESFRTLAAKDAWTHGSGYRTGRDMYCIALNKDYGEIERHRVDIKML